jgi:hypothetical protein
LEEAGYEGRIQIRSDLNDLFVFEPANPTVAVVKSEAILRGSKGMQFNDGPVPAHQCMLYVQLSALRQHLAKFFKSVREKIRLAVIVPRERMSSLDDPINVIRNVSEKLIFLAGFKIHKNILNVR